MLVLSTTSTRALCAGADVAEVLDRAGGIARMEAFARVYAAVEAFPAPTVCVCVGNVVGAGAEIAAGCDLRVGGDNLKLAWAGARLGVPVGPARLTPLVGLAAAKELVFTGRTLGMAEARALGLLHRTAPAAGAEAAAIALAARARRPPARGAAPPQGDVPRAHRRRRARRARERDARRVAAHRRRAAAGRAEGLGAACPGTSPLDRVRELCLSFPRRASASATASRASSSARRRRS